MNKVHVSWDTIYEKVSALPKNKHYWGIPRGGQIIAGLTGQAVDSIEEADVIIDDIIDSGKTAQNYVGFAKPVIALFDKKEFGHENWVVFPWEVTDTEKDIYDTVIRQIEYIGEDVNREGLIKTPERIVKSWDKLYSGYKMNPQEILSAKFTETYDEMVVLKDIEFYSTCEHHFLPFWGKCHIAYIPDGKVIGISKLARLMECYARRFQIQERVCNQIVDAIDSFLRPKGAGCIIEAQHFCMTSRGVEKQKSIMVTSALRGAFKEDVNTRQEFLNFIKGV